MPTSSGERDQPHYVRIAEHYRQQILDGELLEGVKLPTVKELSQRWRVATATVGRALAQLQVEGYLRTSPRGTFVANDVKIGSSARDRLGRVHRTGNSLAEGETAIMTAAELVVPPLYVAELFDLDPGDQVVRREFTIGRGRVPNMFAVTWYPAQFAALVPDLLSTAPQKNAGLTARVLEATGRKVKYARDDMHARDADAREASHLRVKIGAPILAGAHRWADDEGIIEYGEWCLPYRFTIGYEYRFGDE